MARKYKPKFPKIHQLVLEVYKDIMTKEDSPEGDSCVRSWVVIFDFLRAVHADGAIGKPAELAEDLTHILQSVGSGKALQTNVPALVHQGLEHLICMFTER